MSVWQINLTTHSVPAVAVSDAPRAWLPDMASGKHLVRQTLSLVGVKAAAECTLCVSAQHYPLFHTEVAQLYRSVLLHIQDLQMLINHYYALLCC